MFQENKNLILCYICVEEIATEFCRDCNQYFCDKCKLHHLRISSLRDHQFTSYDRGEDQKRLHVEHGRGVVRKRFDNQDLSQECRYLCIHCGPPIVNRKQCSSHSNHLVFDIIGQENKHDLPKIIQMLQTCSTDTKENILFVLKTILEGSSKSMQDAFYETDGVKVILEMFFETRDTAVLDYITSVMLVIPPGKLDVKTISDVTGLLIRTVINFGLRNPEDARLPLFLNGIGIIRNFSDLAFRDFQDGNDHMIIQLREHKHLVSCLIETVRLCVTKFDEVESQCVENCMCTLENLSHDVIDERHEEEHSHKISGLTAIFSKIYKGRQKKTKEKKDGHGLPTDDSECPVDEYEVLWKDASIGLFCKIITNEKTPPITLRTTMGVLINLLPFNWHGAVNISTKLRNQMVLPVLIDCLSDLRDHVLVTKTCHLILCLIFDEKNKYLFGVCAMKHLLCMLSMKTNSDTFSEDIVLPVLSILAEIVRDHEDLAWNLVKENGIEKIKFIKFTPEIYSVEIKEKTSELLSVLWNNKHKHVYLHDSSTLTKEEVKADYVL
ncbi:juxtamembrane domain-associated catenin-like [Mytilus edulis]|uniref:juxtamembrane domain-associated catenin-like n=1 Tax=Mytilus edulis TaxID=6550 RepID=UPI0039EF16E2